MFFIRSKPLELIPKAFFKNEIDFSLTIGPVIENQKLSKPSHALPVTEKFME
jgi:hypothetical protein